MNRAEMSKRSVSNRSRSLRLSPAVTGCSFDPARSAARVFMRSSRLSQTPPKGLICPPAPGHCRPQPFVILYMSNIKLENLQVLFMGLWSHLRSLQCNSVDSELRPFHGKYLFARRFPFERDIKTLCLRITTTYQSDIGGDLVYYTTMMFSSMLVSTLYLPCSK